MMTNKYIVNKNDVSGLDKIPMKRHVDIISVNHFKRMELEAIRTRTPISFGACLHSMGGHTMTSNGISVGTTKYFNKILDFSPEKNIVTVQPGIMWSDLIKFLNQHKKSPSVLQSYCTFSVGGSLSVNAHGITNDYSLSESVLEVGVYCNGIHHRCSREENPELFNAVIGGYGMVGFITDIKLRISDNFKTTSRVSHMNIADFVKLYPSILADDSVKVKYARVNTVKFDTVNLIQYISNGNTIVSDLPPEPRKISYMKQLFFKWIFASRFGKGLRELTESIKGGDSIDSFNVEHMGVNDIVFEDANPITHIWEPLICLNKTHILQEYFVPLSKLEEFVGFVGDTLGKDNNLLNLTIRYVKKDDTTILNYAKEDMCALVFYYRIDKTPQGDSELGIIGKDLIDKTIELGGTFYLPYRPNYDIDKIKECYDWNKFMEIKTKYDPTMTYHNYWLEKVMGSVETPDYIYEDLGHEMMPTDSDEIIRSDDYYTKIFSKATDEDIKAFAKYVFTIPDSDVLVDLIRKSLTEKGNIYDELAYMGCGIKVLKQLNLLKQTKKEIGNELVSLLTNMGYTKNNTIQGVVMVGDPGRYAKYLTKNFNITGNVYCMTETQSMTDMLEYGSFSAPGKFIPVDYHKFRDDLSIPSNTIDMMFVPVGLHHFSEDDQFRFIMFAKRVLRPEGRLIIREHDASDDKVRNMAHVAHTIFNAVTGVTAEDDAAEIRSFRPVGDWEHIISKEGFHPEHVYQFDVNDSSGDIMFCMTKDGIRCNDYTSSTPNEVYYSIPEWWIVFNTQDQGKWMETIPFYEYPYFGSLMTYWKVVCNTMIAAKNNNGLASAVFNEGTLMTLTTGTIMSLQFGFMSLISAPIRWFCHTKWGKPRNVCDAIFSFDVEEEQYTNVTTQLEDIGCKIKYFHDGTYYVEMPRYKPMIKVLKYVALNGGYIDNIGNLPKITVMYYENKDMYTDSYLMKEISRFTMHSNRCDLVKYELPTHVLTHLLAVYPDVEHIWD